ncbi:HhH-GPD-type base excision DNA repair protein [Yonghaparkia sp. Soil809]|uniref:HhH-GPD-type base excision DNA repair protein n=1 Tax=Yonghaparkia sp. Soil809 TaxID=1736417 RepID=UPI0006FECCD3|nr:HhH-GPD-type base excision DNA repair protein [Yonghaparkia sp. Soil809]KRF33535.1 Fe-S cluster assembly protein HesB [Yonghaparkia sp. Soil809]
MALNITGDAPADALLTDDPFALLVGMLLDQQVPMETAFAGPAKIRERMGSFDAESIAAADPEAFAAVFKESPAVHRFPGSMAARVQALAAEVRDEWGGRADAIWTRPGLDGLAPDGAEVLRRLQELPGFGEQKAKIFLALLGKQYGVDAPGWRVAAGDYGVQGSYRSVADIVDADSLAKVREAKKAAKAKSKAAKG